MNIICVELKFLNFLVVVQKEKQNYFECKKRYDLNIFTDIHLRSNDKHRIKLL